MENIVPHGVAEFWARSDGAYPDLSKVALRVLATPASSASSERDFSAVSRILTPERSTIYSDMLNDILLLRSAETAV